MAKDVRQLGRKRGASGAAAQEAKRGRTAAFRDVKTFFSRKAELRLLSNFAEVPVTVKGIEYPTGEHCFHAHKYLHAASLASDPARAQELTTYAGRFRTGGAVGSEGLAAKRAGSKGSGLRLTDAEKEGWTPAAEAVQLLICQGKAARQDVRVSLLDTRGAYLLHQDNRAKADTHWGGKIPGLKEKLSAAESVTQADVVGMNRLGQIWMEVRAELAADRGN